MTRGARTDDETIRTFLATDYPRLVAALSLTSGSRPAAEDAVQEALARAWERSERGERIEALRAWVMTVSLNLIRSGWRRTFAERRARSRLTGGPMARSPEVARRPDRRGAGAGRPPRRQREAVVLHYYLSMPVSEIAKVLGVVEGTVKTTLFRARHALALALREDEDSEEATDRAGH